MIKLLIILLFSISIIPFTSTGDVFAGTGQSGVSAGGQTAWTNPGNIVSDNTTDATCAAASASARLCATNFSFSIPEGSSINGVSVNVEASEHSGGTEALLASLINGGCTSPIGTAKTNTNEGNLNGTAKKVYTFGSTNDVWGATLNKTVVESPTFGVHLYFNTAHDVRVDYVTMAVEYTIPSGRRFTIISKR